jgi:hypothetical protein
MAQAYRRKPTSASLINSHFVWCPKYRRQILGGPVKIRPETHKPGELTTNERRVRATLLKDLVSQACTLSTAITQPSRAGPKQLSPSTRGESNGTSRPEAWQLCNSGHLPGALARLIHRLGNTTSRPYVGQAGHGTGCIASWSAITACSMRSPKRFKIQDGIFYLCQRRSVPTRVFYQLVDVTHRS